MAGTNPPGGFSFGTGQTTGFNFGTAAGIQGQQQQQQQPTLPGAGGMKFGAQPAGGPTLNAPKAGTAPFSQSTPSFSFGTPASQTSGFSLSGGGSAATSAPSVAPASSGGFSFGAMTSQPAAAATSIGFGQTTAPASTAPGLGSTGFGTATSALGAGGAGGLFPAPAGGLSMGLGGGAPSQSQAATSLTPTTSTISFGVKPPTAATTAAPTSTATAGFGFGGAGVANAASTTSQSGFQLGGTTTATASAAIPAPGGGFSLGGGLKLPTSTVSATAATTSASTTALGSLLGASLSAASSTASAAGSVAGGGAGASKGMTYRQLEEAINKWTGELEEQEKIFLQQATQVNAWDRLIMDNGEKIVQLNKEVDRVKMDQQKLDHELDFIHSQQRELTELLEPLEKALDQLPPISYQQHADVEREHTYQLAESIDSQLKTMGKDLKEIIDRLNASNAQQDPNDPVQQITKILNAHMDSLLWIDRHTSTLNRRVEDIAKQMDSQRREQERNFRLAYS